MKKRRLILLASFALISVILIIFFTRKGNGLKVETVELLNEKVAKTVSASGVVKSHSDANLAFAATGKITFIGGKKGDEVKKDHLILQLDKFSQSQSTQALKDTRDVAINNRDLFLEQNSGDSNIEYRQSDEYKIKLRTLDEQVNLAEANYQASLGGATNLKIVAPFDGTMLNLTKEMGEVAVAGETVVRIADLNKLFFEVLIDQEDFGFLEVGQPVEIKLDAYEDQEFDGVVFRLPKYAEKDEAGDDTFVVEIQIIPQEEYPILLGMTGDANIVVKETENDVQALEFDSIVMGDKPYVWILNGNLLEKKFIEIGLEGDLTTEVKTDLHGYTIVIPADSKTELRERQKAKVVD